jgi:chorismate mutase/prephenate dehydratase
MTKPDNLDLTAVREQIDAIDAQLHQLLNDRARLAQAVGISKTASGSMVDFYRPEREAQVLRMVKERNQGPLRTEDLLRLFREIMSACLAQQEPLKVAFLGPEGTFTQAAVLTHFGHSVRALPLPSVDEVFHEVESGSVDFGVVAIENSTEGMVINTLDRFLNSSARICGEIELRIHHFLMGRMGSLEGIKRICSHQQALAQCRLWLDEHLPGVERVAVTSNAEGARRARDEQGTAAIAGATAAEVYGLNVLAPQIEDRQDNTVLRAGSQDLHAQWPGPHDPDRLHQRDRILRSAGEAARALRDASHQHDPYRVAAFAEAQMGLCVLHRYRRTCRGRARRCRTRGSAATRLAAARTRVLPARRHR